PCPRLARDRLAPARPRPREADVPLLRPRLPPDRCPRRAGAGRAGLSEDWFPQSVASSPQRLRRGRADHFRPSEPWLELPAQCVRVLAGLAHSSDRPWGGGLTRAAPEAFSPEYDRHELPVVATFATALTKAFGPADGDCPA